MNNLFTLNPKVSTALAVLIGYLLIEDLSAAEQNTLGNWLMLISQLLITNATSQQLIESYLTTNNMINLNNETIKNKYNPLFYDTETLKKIIKETYPETFNNIFNDMHKRISDLEILINKLYGK